jgi:tetratricopeptide (TPR) repeat protein
MPRMSQHAADRTSDGEDDGPSGDARECLLLWYRATPIATTEAGARVARARVTTRLEVEGGEILVRAGNSIAASFDPLELEEVIDLALELLADARAEADTLEVACALAVGELDEEGGPAEAVAIDRALLLAANAAPLELVLDDLAHERVKDSHLFTRPVLAGPVAGQALDTLNPKRRDCRRALSALEGAPLAPGARAVFEQLYALASEPGTRHIALYCSQAHAGLDLLERLRTLLAPSLVLHVGRQAGSLQPLGGLQLALTRARVRLHQLADPALAAAIERLTQGAALSRDEAVVALRELLRRAGSNGQRAWLLLDHPREVDPASVSVISEAIAEQAGEHVLWLLAETEASLPAGLLEPSDPAPIALPPLSEPDRAQVAGAVLGLDPSSELARRVALLAGDTALGVVEAARTLVGSGDLVLHEDGFRWRTQPRHASLPIPIDALLTERAAGLDPEAHRVLEALCLAPPAAAPDFVEHVTALDGMSAQAAQSGREQLEREGWFDAYGGLGPLEDVVRNAVRNSMPPSRAAELHRFVAQALRELPALAHAPCFAHALLAHHLIEGGREQEAAAALLDAAQASSDSGFPRLAVRLAAIALRQDGSRETRERAGRVAGAIDTSSPASTRPPAPAPSSSQPPTARSSSRAPARRPFEPKQLAQNAMQAAIAAILRGEIDSAEGLIDTAVAAGFGRAAAQRLWSVAQLRHGDVPEAVRTLKDAHVPSAGAATRSREAIAAALILLESGESVDAVRSALEALASTRRAQDARGEQVALYVLSSCYRSLGREAEADRLASTAAASDPG